MFLKRRAGRLKKVKMLKFLILDHESFCSDTMLEYMISERRAERNGKERE